MLGKKSLKIPKAKGVIRILNSKKDTQHSDQKKKDKRTNNDLLNKQTKHYGLQVISIKANQHCGDELPTLPEYMSNSRFNGFVLLNL